MHNVSMSKSWDDLQKQSKKTTTRGNVDFKMPEANCCCSNMRVKRKTKGLTALEVAPPGAAEVTINDHRFIWLPSSIP